MVDGTVRQAAIAKICIRSEIFTGCVEALCLHMTICDVILGNIILSQDKSEGRDVIGAVVTRSQERRDKSLCKPLVTADIDFPDISQKELKRFQEDDVSISRLFNLAVSGKEIKIGKVKSAKFVVEGGILYRYHFGTNHKMKKQLVLPLCLRKNVMKLGHEAIMAGHLGIAKTTDRIQEAFFWPGFQGDIMRFCKSCDICQRCVPRGRVSKATLQAMPLIKTPFERVAMDLVGPISPPSDSGNRFILTVVDFATRYPEAVALKNKETVTVAEALVHIYSRVGVPKEVLTDQGSEFVSELMKEVERLLSIKHITTIPYHPQCNGLTEKFNAVLKQMLKKLCHEKPKSWDRYLDALLFAYREVPQESMKFSPFELLYGRAVRGPMHILRELWTKEINDTDTKTTYQYVMDLRNKLEDTCSLAQQHLEKNQQRYKRNFDQKAKLREFKVGSKVLILLPTDHNKLLMQWKGPFVVLERMGKVDYKIKFSANKEKIFHVNMLKQYRYYERSELPVVGFVTVIENDDDDETAKNLDQCQLQQQEETIMNVNINPQLNTLQRKDIENLLVEFSDVFSSKPGLTDLVQHEINLTSEKVVRSRPYPVPFALRQQVDREIHEMLELDIIEPSQSAFASPLLLIKKKDGTFRPVVDFRKLNAITVFDAEPMDLQDNIFAKIANDKFFSKIDFCKGYWQIPLRQDDRHKTAFVTEKGLFQFKRMPFGLVCSGASYCRMMRKLLEKRNNVDSYVDDVLAHTVEWQSHVETLRSLFQAVRQARLTMKPSKCFLGYNNVQFLGHDLGGGELKMEMDKVDRLLHAPIPITKTDVKAFIGLASYYRKFIPDFAVVIQPLTDLTKKGAPNKVTWGKVEEMAFIQLREKLCLQPVLKLPDISKIFVLRTDASDKGVGGVLLQDHNGLLCPISYISRKLLVREQHFSVIEKECLAIVWAVEKFQRYLYGREFILQVDHEPLSFMNKAKLSNPRVMRWVLALQPYRFRLEVIKGNQNVGADFLSRVV